MFKSFTFAVRSRTVCARSCTEQRALSTGTLRKPNSEHANTTRSFPRRFRSTSSQPSIAPQTASIPSTPSPIPQSSVNRIQPPLGLVEDTLEHAVEILSTTFQDDPFMRYWQFDDEAAGPQTRKLSYEYLKPVRADILTSFIQDEGATLVTLPGRDLTSAWSVAHRFTSHPHH
jgi:hypothetical protein